jgi:hypothetical protein
MKRIGLLLLILLSPYPMVRAEINILVPRNPSSLESLAAEEIRRYLYLRTGELASINTRSTRGPSLVIFCGRQDRDWWQKNAWTETAALAAQQFLIKTIKEKNSKTIAVIGGDDQGLLYAAYRFAEFLGVRFYLHGDVVPDQRLETIPDMNELGKPLFALRGIQPFHDFPEGPDWWTRDDYLCYVTQLAKMRMNFFGLHCYPEDRPHAEPSVWIGLPQDVDSHGLVSFAYPTMWANTRRVDYWGYHPMTTSEFCSGANLLFPENDYYHPVQKEILPQPRNLKQSNELFDRTGRMYADIFAAAKRLGIKTCIGTETPLIIPRQVKVRMQAQSIDTSNTRLLYKGIFKRLTALGAPDYYWLWTPEGWTWEGNDPRQFDATVRDMQDALAALHSLGDPMTLATCGWVLGPQHDRAALDKILPKNTALSCINRQVGHEPVEPFFANIKDRPKWAIPWMENDPNLISYQPWVGRMRRDAADARRLGCDGLFGIHWRTKILSPNVSALALAGWDQSWIPVDFDVSPARPVQAAPVRVNGNVSSFTEPVSDADLPAIYQSVRWGMKQYSVAVANGLYAVTLKFNEPFYRDSGKRVFSVALQNNKVIDHLDIFARVGHNRALDLTFENIAVVDSVLHLNFEPIVDFPGICGIVIAEQTGGKIVRKINCGGANVADFAGDLQPMEIKGEGKDRTMPMADFYHDFCCAWFGESIAEKAGTVLSDCDGLAAIEPANWKDGPGGIVANTNPWTVEKKKYDYVEKFAALRSAVAGAGNLQRFDYWMNTLYYHRDLGEIGCMRGQLDDLVSQIKKEINTVQRTALLTKAVTLRIEMSRVWERTMTHLLAAVDTPGEFGTMANLEQHNRAKLQFLSQHDSLFYASVNGLHPAMLALSDEYQGVARLLVPTVRTLINAGDRLDLSMIALDNAPAEQVALFWRPLGKGAFNELLCKNIGRAVYQVQLPPSAKSFEYYIHAVLASGQTLRWPATAPELNQTVVVAVP